MEQLLPHDERIHWILDKGARLLDGGAEPVSGVILPTGESFPDPFDGSPEAVQRLLKRVVKHAGLSDVPIEGKLVMPEGEMASGGCASGACGVPSAAPTQVSRVETIGEGYRVNILANELGNPVILLTAMVRAVSHIFLQEAELASVFGREDYEHGIDLAGVWLGFGSLLSNGAYVYRKG
ncbi:MAG: hypothetical protein KC731_42820 [Myxococcales bacterium]|nr:hypothetical protein [Myxococcales bacterium]